MKTKTLTILLLTMAVTTNVQGISLTHIKHHKKHHNSKDHSLVGLKDEDDEESIAQKEEEKKDAPVKKGAAKEEKKDDAAKEEKKDEGGKKKSEEKKETKEEAKKEDTKKEEGDDKKEKKEKKTKSEDKKEGTSDEKEVKGVKEVKEANGLEGRDITGKKVKMVTDLVTADFEDDFSREKDWQRQCNGEGGAGIGTVEAQFKFSRCKNGTYDMSNQFVDSAAGQASLKSLELYYKGKEEDKKIGTKPDEHLYDTEPVMGGRTKRQLAGIELEFQENRDVYEKSQERKAALEAKKGESAADEMIANTKKDKDGEEGEAAQVEKTNEDLRERADNLEKKKLEEKTGKKAEKKEDAKDAAKKEEKPAAK